MGLNGPIFFGDLLMLLLLSLALLPLHLYVIGSFLVYLVDYVNLNDADRADRLIKLVLLMLSVLTASLLLINATPNNTSVSQAKTNPAITVDQF